nr:MAG TPA: hypothetical protein [Caudoviricetes sp.]
MVSRFDCHLPPHKANNLSVFHGIIWRGDAVKPSPSSIR